MRILKLFKVMDWHQQNYFYTTVWEQGAELCALSVALVKSALQLLELAGGRSCEVCPATTGTSWGSFLWSLSPNYWNQLGGEAVPAHLFHGSWFRTAECHQFDNRLSLPRLLGDSLIAGLSKGRQTTEPDNCVSKLLRPLCDIADTKAS